MKIRIFKPTKSATQSGKNKQKKWLMEPIIEENIREINPMMGWTSIKNTSTQFKLSFNSLEEAVEYGKKNNLEFVVQEAKESSIKKKSYSENFTS
jgi:hypothetical protein